MATKPADLHRPRVVSHWITVLLAAMVLLPVASVAIPFVSATFFSCWIDRPENRYQIGENVTVYVSSPIFSTEAAELGDGSYWLTVYRPDGSEEERMDLRELPLADSYPSTVRADVRAEPPPGQHMVKVLDGDEQLRADCGPFTVVAMPDVMYRGDVVGVSFSEYTVIVDEVLQDPTGTLRQSDSTLAIVYREGQLIGKIQVGFCAEVYGELSSESSGPDGYQVNVYQSYHYLKEIPCIGGIFVDLLSATTDGKTEVGSIAFDGREYALPAQVWVTSGQWHNVTANPPDGYAFDHWEFQGEVGVPEGYEVGQASLVIVIWSEGSAKAWFREVPCPPPTVRTETVRSTLTKTTTATSSTERTIVKTTTTTSTACLLPVPAAQCRPATILILVISALLVSVLLVVHYVVPPLPPPPPPVDPGRFSFPDRFENVHFHVEGKNVEELQELGTRPRALRSLGQAEIPFNNDEAAARFYLTKLFSKDLRLAVRGLRTSVGAGLVPDLRMLGTENSPLTKTRLVKFEQTHASIPIFGSRAVVEIDENHELVSADAEMAEVGGVSPLASLSPSQALEKIANEAGVAIASLNTVEPPELNFYHDDRRDSWHLAYFFKKVPAAPARFLELASERRSRGHGLLPSPRETRPLLNYLVDAHMGEMLLYYSATPMLEVPSKCRGFDEENNVQDFWGRKTDGGFEMIDPLRAIKTFDLQFRNLDSTLPTDPVRNPANDWSEANRAAVSAHASATRVYDFYKSVLLRDGIDNKGMDLVSIVNCTCPNQQHPPEWHNARWMDGKMWYGQEKDPGGTFRSYSRFLDVIAHELTHGVTEYTSDLIYNGQSGALNESFSDIFGVIIKNWQTGGADVSSWNWEIGAGLGRDGLPLRDFSNPRRTGDPDHMNEYLSTIYDNGGVHTNSNIHNKAAYNVLTAKDTLGQRVFPQREAAILYYLCLTRLNSLATFSKALQVLLDAAKTFYVGDANLGNKLAHIKEAYGKVGIA